ncbi:hypothetical protein LWM68_01680 [Niabella sp. W65]|nr:hypothetical protein [Niabella sp. W65]MCH7361607.1 hypothetical protein [Niabella sp. W65]
MHIHVCAILAHILERHYAPMARHPGADKFTISVELIVFIIKEAFAAEAKPAPQSCNYQRVWDAGSIVGYDVAGSATQVVAVIADAAGRIITAFTGVMGILRSTTLRSG